MTTISLMAVSAVIGACLAVIIGGTLIGCLIAAIIGDLRRR